MGNLEKSESTTGCKFMGSIQCYKDVTVNEKTKMIQIKIIQV